MILTILSYLFSFCTLIAIIVITYFKWVYAYWERKGIAYVEPEIPYGNIKEVIKETKTTGQVLADIYFEMKSKNKMHAGFFFLHLPGYVPIDLNLIKHIMQVDFQHFVDHGVYSNEKDDPLSAHLFSIEGQKWRNLRVKLTPTFTSGKMKMMFPIMSDISDHLIGTVKKNRDKVEIKELSARFTTDIIGSCAFGIDCNSLTNPNTEFNVQGRRLFQLNNYELARTFATFIMPKLTRFFGAKLLPEVSTEFFMNVIKENVKLREETNVRRNDFFQLLLDLKNAPNGENITLQEFAAQAFLFFVAGFETSSLTMSFTLYELAKNPHVQEKLRAEIARSWDEHGKFTYDSIAELEYLEMVIKETLRKYPPIGMLTRVCTQDYSVPNSRVVLKKGVRVFIPVEAIHYDPEFFPEPEKFEPERFTEENVNKRHHFCYLPFGEGPRICIGLRFGLMQTKLGVASVIKNYKVKVNKETTPIKMNPRHFLNFPINPIWLDFEEI